MRQAAATDFTIDVPKVGTFTFGRRTMADELDIQVEYAKIIKGVIPTEWLKIMGGWLSDLRVMTVKAPADWDLDAMDPFDDETYTKLGQVHAAYIEQERSFRRSKSAASQG